MPGRWVREGIISSPRVNALSMGAEILYRRLMSVVDDFGRFHAAPASVRGACWPTCPEKFSDEIVGQWLAECSQPANNMFAEYESSRTENYTPLLFLYSVDGARYLQITDFGQTKRTKSKFPGPANNLPTDCKQSVGSNRISISISKSLSEQTLDDLLEEISVAFDQHLKHNRKEPRDLVIQNLISMNGKFDWQRFRANHPLYCDHYAAHGWDFCTLSFMGWINAGMPPPPPPKQNMRDKSDPTQPVRSNLPNVRELMERDRKRDEEINGKN